MIQFESSETIFFLNSFEIPQKILSLVLAVSERYRKGIIC